MTDKQALPRNGYGVHHAVCKAAQAVADATGADFGIEKSPYGSGPFRFFSLPGERYRQGFELRCEVVSCTDLDKCQPGHGPDARGNY